MYQAESGESVCVCKGVSGQLSVGVCSLNHLESTFFFFFFFNRSLSKDIFASTYELILDCEVRQLVTRLSVSVYYFNSKMSPLALDNNIQQKKIAIYLFYTEESWREYFMRVRERESGTVVGISPLYSKIRDPFVDLQLPACQVREHHDCKCTLT